MRTYTDAKVRHTLMAWVAKSSYRKVAQAIGVDHGYLHNIITAAKPVPAEVAAAVGFVPVPEVKRWMRRIDLAAEAHKMNNGN